MSAIAPEAPFYYLFFNQKLLHECSKKNSESAKESVPGSNYFLKILTFWNNDYIRAKLFKLFKLFIKRLARGEWRTLLTLEWIGPKCNRISQPIPDPKNLMHYLHVFSTPLIDRKGRNRETDNWQPRAQITKAFNEGLISLENKRGNI